MTIQIKREPPGQPEIRLLLEASDAAAHALYPVESNHLVDAETMQAEGMRFFVVRADGVALGCGGFRRIGPDAEIKRMFVTETARGLGLGRMILETIEAAALAEGVAVLRLETGNKSTEALALYRNAGFSETGPFGSYGPDPYSVFMAKTLNADRHCGAQTGE